MIQSLSTLLVGAFARRGAKALLAHLPSEAALWLVKEPQNEYDPSALRVELRDLSQVPESEIAALSQELEEFGLTLEDLADTIFLDGGLHLGYVAATGGKPLAKAGLQVGNLDFGRAMGQASEAKASLAFSPEGAPMVRMEVGE